MSVTASSWECQCESPEYAQVTVGNVRLSFETSGAYCSVCQKPVSINCVRFQLWLKKNMPRRHLRLVKPDDDQ